MVLGPSLSAVNSVWPGACTGGRFSNPVYLYQCPSLALGLPVVRCSLALACTDRMLSLLSWQASWIHAANSVCLWEKQTHRPRGTSSSP